MQLTVLKYTHAVVENRLLRALAEHEVLLGDGANGTLLAELGFERQPYDIANLLAPELVLQAHQAYVEAGADLIETNTFCANQVKLGHTNFDLHEMNRQGAVIARQAAGDKIVLGAVGPCGKPLEPIGSLSQEEAYASFCAQAKALKEGGVDGFILETFIDLEELQIAARACQAVAPELPLIACKAFIEDGDALLEGLPGRCTSQMELPGVVSVGANCVVGPQRMIDIVRQLCEASKLPILAMPTPGLPQLVKGKVVYDVAPDYFAASSIRLIEEGARIIGGCCGTNPEHIRQMRAVLDSGKFKAKRPRASHLSASEAKQLESTPPTELAQKIELGKFIVSVEMDLPRGLNVGKILDGARQLKIRGADLIDISDGARARLRMNPMSVCKLIQDEVGIETMMHFACRDRNLLAVQADLLGAHALGVRNILAVTGDPANIGDYPSATSVYDVDAIGLVRILNRFNEGIDLAGYSVGKHCAFSIAIAFNPMAPDLSVELDRLKRKMDAGAHMIYTQPIFERAAIERTLEITKEFGLPVLIGVLPLKNARHAEFMHNEVPGIEIPEWLRTQMRRANSDDEALKIGVEEAKSLAQGAKELAHGMYLMPPFGSASIAAEILDEVK